MYDNDKDLPSSEARKNIFSDTINNWKKKTKKDKTDAQKGEEDALAALSTLDEKSNAIRQKTIKRFVSIVLFLSIGMFILTGLVKVYYILSKGETRKPIKTKVQDVKLEINTFSKWQEIKDQEIIAVNKNIKNVDNNLTKKIKNVKTELKKEIKSTTKTIVSKIDENQKTNTAFTKSMLEELKTEISKSEMKVRQYADNKTLSIEEKIKKIKKREINSINKAKSKLDFSKLSLPSLPSLGNGKKSARLSKNNTVVTSSAPAEDEVEVEEQISVPVLSKVSTLTLEDKNKNKAKKLPSFFVMPGFTKGTIITGADVPTLARGKNNPKPVWISITGDTLIANNDAFDVDECLLQASATGDFASGVAEIRLSQISCSATDDKGKKFKIFAKIKGWIYGENGKYGVKGRIVGKEGKIIEKAIPLTVLQGAIAALGNIGSSGTTILSGGTTGSNNVANSASKASTNSASKVLSKFSDYYLKILESLNPIIEVKAGREVVIAFAGGEKLKLEKYTPANINYFEDKGELK